MKRLAVLGHPVSHSRSPAMQNAALADLGLAGEWIYEAIDVAPEDFPDLVSGMRGDGFVGANVTVPHKQAALIVADEATLAAREIGAANTLSFASSGIAAENTDAPGLIDAIDEPVTGQERACCSVPAVPARAVLWALNRRRRPRFGLEPDRDQGRRTGGGARRHARGRTRRRGMRPDRQRQRRRTRRRRRHRGTADRSGRFRARPDRGRHGLRRRAELDPRRGRSAAARGRSTASRCWFARVRTRCALWTGLDPSLEVMREAARG